MSDPLSVAAGVVGLLTAAAQTALILKELITKARDAPQICRRVRDEVEDIRNVLGKLQMYLSGSKQATQSRKALIMIDQIAATLASCITTVDKLKLFIESLRSESQMGILDRVRWVYKTDELEDFQNRLEAHKSSLTLMLIILTCQKQDDAEDKVDALRDKVDQIYAMSAMITQRMTAWDMHQVGVIPDASTVMGDRNGLAHATADIAVNQQSPWATDMVPEQVKRDNRGFAFEELLMNSRVYRNAAHNNSEAFSVVTAAGRTATWSMLTGLSLSEISHMAILAIPVYAHDLNDKQAYNFDVPATDTDNAVSQVEDIKLKISSSESPKGKRSLRNLFKRTPASSEQLEGPRAGQSEVVVSQQRVFGIPIAQSITYANTTISLTDEEGNSFIYGYVPIIVAKCGVFLKEKGTDVEDIFARNGHAARIAVLQRTFDTPDRYGKGFDWTGYTVHDTANLLLRYLKSLPEPIIPYDHYDDFVAHFRTGPPQDARRDEVVKDLQLRILELPALSRQSLLYLLDFLAVFAKKSSVNRMTAARLVSSFQPSFLSKRPAEMDSEEHVYAADATIFLVVSQENFLIGMPASNSETATQPKASRDRSDTLSSPGRLGGIAEAQAELEGGEFVPDETPISSLPTRAASA